MKHLTGKIGLIGDVHQEDRYLKRTLQYLADLGIHDVLCTGDIVDGEGNADNTIELLADTGVYVVRGNHDRWFLLGTMRDLMGLASVQNLKLNVDHIKKWAGRLDESIGSDEVTSRVQQALAKGATEVMRQSSCAADALPTEPR